jgi:hypothetical protein
MTDDRVRDPHGTDPADLAGEVRLAPQELDRFVQETVVSGFRLRQG